MEWHFDDVSPDTIYFVTRECPTCDSLSRAMIEAGRNIAAESLALGHHHGFIVVQQGNSRYRVIVRELMKRFPFLSLPVFYYDGHIFVNPDELSKQIESETK